MVLNVRVTEGTGLEAVQIAQTECNEDIKAFALIYDSVLKENEMILCGSIAAPNLDLQQQEVIYFLCETCISSNLILTKQELSDLGSLQAWWNNKFKREIEDMVKKYDLFQKNILSSKDLFSNVADQILSVMSTILTLWTTCVLQSWSYIFMLITQNVLHCGLHVFYNHWLNILRQTTYFAGK